MILYLKDLKDSNRKLLDLTNIFTKTAGDKFNTHTLVEWLKCQTVCLASIRP
jgi:hypothetical protein